MAKAKLLIQIGGEKIKGISNLDQQFEFHYVDVSLYKLEESFEKLSAIPLENPNNSGNIFLFGSNEIEKLSLEILRYLPSYQIFYEDIGNTSVKNRKVLALKGAMQVNLLDQGYNFVEYLNVNYAVKPWGTSIDNSMVELSKNFFGEIQKKGSGKFIFDGDFGDDFSEIILWKNKWGPTGRTQLHAEIKVHGENIKYFYRAYYEKDGEIILWDFDGENLNLGEVYRNIGFPNFPLNIALFAKGRGKLEIGDIHLRYHLSSDNFLAIGGKRLVDPNRGNEELGYYFNVGDLKPPLNIYFSGFRPSEGYEGRWMMGSLGSPFMLVYDPRIVGGAFYRGGNLEKQLVEIIQEKLDYLGFTNNQLNLSGLSMGTYASFYYGAMLEPHGILVGKPLAGIGNLALNSRLYSPYEWDLAMDTIIHTQGELNKDSALEMDKDFWNLFLSADFSKTTFAIAYMLQDTDRPFNKIFKHLKENYPTAKVLHKGLEGRHNDDTNGINTWFFKQYQDLLAADFKRNFHKNELETEIKEVSDE
ncbi:accessory Sec system protein Asp2 [Weissella koreensis]|uniref:accessory Sec system protein Asp2 n=1 Tax=Weissella koreensis TaxID=165096 RepID=UPI00026F18A0|nr:accessory Sec system protein Asp2 [Weissella koreensis]AVH74523.1 accessory Sec system protein Asp2 [Weissella koreensis]EJF34159.1 hypothetical protein JC2156_00410 [Weissella koreensis KCTC 3621]QGN19747.1 accessory Sec system protein Asp2 [Weissella koreensis]